MTRLLIGAIVGAALTLAAEVAFVWFGGMPMDAKSKPFPMEKFLAHKALKASMGESVNDASPIPETEANLLAGARIYSRSCADCHGRLDQKPPPFALGEFPPPPQLLPPNKGVSDDSAGETHWKVRNGIRLSGMPAFVDSLSETEMWQVSLFLAKSDKLPASALTALKERSNDK